jgi:hypothetical protein
VPLKQIAAVTTLPEGWIYNIIEGKYSEERNKRRGASWAKKGQLIFVPIGFGIEPVDLQQLISAELLKRVDEIKENLDITLQELSEYRCPYCDSRQSASGGVPLSEHHDGYYQVFECGYRTIDGFVEGLCPKDPKFPTLHDFELRTHQTSDDDWVCYAAPLTRYARKVELSNARPGKTEGDARQRMIERYRVMKGELRWDQVWPFAKQQTLAE